MTKEELAAKLNGREYGSEITKAEEAEARASGLVVVFGYSDDNAELRGAIYDEIGCYNGGEFRVSKSGVISINEEDAEVLKRFGVYSQVIAKGTLIQAVWHDNGPAAWTYETKMPNASFEIMEEGSIYCHGIVFSIDDLPQ